MRVLPLTVCPGVEGEIVHAAFDHTINIKVKKMQVGEFCSHMYVHVCVHACAHTCVYAYMCVHMHVHLYVLIKKLLNSRY